MLEDGLIFFFDIFIESVIVFEDGEPIFWEWFFGKVVVFGLVFLFGQQLSYIFEIGICELVLSRDNVVNLIEEGSKFIPEGNFHGF